MSQISIFTICSDIHKSHKVRALRVPLPSPFNHYYQTPQFDQIVTFKQALQLYIQITTLRGCSCGGPLYVWNNFIIYYTQIKIFFLIIQNIMTQTKSFDFCKQIETNLYNRIILHKCIFKSCISGDISQQRGRMTPPIYSLITI